MLFRSERSIPSQELQHSRLTAKGTKKNEAADILSQAYIKNEVGDNTMSQRGEKNEAADIHHKNEAGDNSMSQDLKIGKEPMVES